MEDEKEGCTELVSMSNFSFLRGASHPEELVQKAHEIGLNGVALADRNSLAGIVRAHEEAEKLSLPFMPGSRLILQDSLDIICLPTTRRAYGRLSKLLTLGKRRTIKGECELYLEDVAAYGEEQVFILLPAKDMKNSLKDNLAKAARLMQVTPHVYLGASCWFDGKDENRLQTLSQLAGQIKVPMVAVGDVLYHTSERRQLADILTCIREKTTIDQAGFLLEANAERHLKSASEMRRLFKSYEDAINNTNKIAALCQFSLNELKYEYPDEPYDPFPTPQAALEHYTWKGADKRYPQGIPIKIRTTIQHELTLVAGLNYARYFLTVFDIVRFARRQGILCQGRGSAANSAVCYCLGITSVDPHEIDLLFERFISAERGEPPDIDVDFEHERREEVIQYIYAKYGRHRAGIAATIITYRAKSAIREVSKALGLSEDIATAITSSVWGSWGKMVKDEDVAAAGLDPENPRLRHALNLAREIMGFPRHLGQHTGGFVITRGPLDEVVPIGNAAMDERTFVEWDKNDLDALGILKIDVLGLGMLSCIRKCFGLLSHHYGLSHNLASIPQNDQPTYGMISKADTVGVFQIESRAQMSMLPRLRPACFYDLVIEVAIVRPGPIQGDMVHPYLRRRQKLESVTYPTEELRRVLEKTLGVPLFQEQAMKIAIIGAGFTPEEADGLRRAMATFRRAGTIQHYREKFIKGMTSRGYKEDFAQRCFKQIEGFGDYGFPESHAASFALLVYVSSWLKCHYPAVFACGLINSQPMGFYAPAQIVRDLREHDGQVLEADINFSHFDCTLEKEDSKALTYALRLGFRLLKGLSPVDAHHIVDMRETKLYLSLEDFIHRTRMKPASLQILARADAFRSLGLDRRQALYLILASKAPHAPLTLLDDPVDNKPEPLLPAMAIGEHVMHDYAAFRLSLKSHPLALIRRHLPADYVQAQDLRHLPTDRIFNVAGLVLVRQKPGSAKGVVFLTLEDETGVANIIVWPKVFERFHKTLMVSRLISVRGKLQREQDVIHIVANHLEDQSHLIETLTGETKMTSNQAGQLVTPYGMQRCHPSTRTQQTKPASDAPNTKALPKGRNFH